MSPLSPPSMRDATHEVPTCQMRFVDKKTADGRTIKILQQVWVVQDAKGYRNVWRDVPYHQEKKDRSK